MPRPAASTFAVAAFMACLAATWVVWGSTYLAIKYALISFPPFLQMGSRFLFAGLLLMAWMRWRGAVVADPRAVAQRAGGRRVDARRRHGRHRACRGDRSARGWWWPSSPWCRC
jgi:drug/metabolite transporter (DMT)-like permease